MLVLCVFSYVFIFWLIVWCPLLGSFLFDCFLEPLFGPMFTNNIFGTPCHLPGPDKFAYTFVNMFWATHLNLSRLSIATASAIGGF